MTLSALSRLLPSTASALSLSPWFDGLTRCLSGSTKWLAKGKPWDKKHVGVFHPLLSLLLSALFFSAGANFGTKWVLEATAFKPEKLPLLRGLAVCLIVYWIAMMGSRISLLGTWNMYEGIWACNAAMIVAIEGLLLNNPNLVGAAICSVTVDQVLWYCDVVTYYITGRCWAGVAKYMFVPETPAVNKITGTHHLWFIPICLWILRINDIDVRLSFMGPSFIVSSCLVVASRFLTPFELWFPKSQVGVKRTFKGISVCTASTTVSASNAASDDDDSSTVDSMQFEQASIIPSTTDNGNAKNRKELRRRKRPTIELDEGIDPVEFVVNYLNINLAYECWRDVDFADFLHWFDHEVWYTSLPWNLLMWNSGNLLLYIPLCILC